MGFLDTHNARMEVLEMSRVVVNLESPGYGTLRQFLPIKGMGNVREIYRGYFSSV